MTRNEIYFCSTAIYMCCNLSRQFPLENLDTNYESLGLFSFKKTRFMKMAWFFSWKSLFIVTLNTRSQAMSAMFLFVVRMDRNSGRSHESVLHYCRLKTFPNCQNPDKNKKSLGNSALRRHQIYETGLIFLMKKVLPPVFFKEPPSHFSTTYC